jgi:hypothetical protein
VPAKLRIAKGRRPTFSADVLALFAELEREAMPDPAFSDGARELAVKLDLVTAFWVGCTPLDRSDAPCHPPGYLSYELWFRCREVREQLLAAIGAA